MMSKKELIVQSAIELFQEQGIDKTTVADIVKRANIAQGTFYIYFPSKLALMPALAEEMVKVLMEHIGEKIAASQSIKEKMANIVAAIFTVNEQYPEVLAVVYSGLASTEHLKQWETVYEPCYDMISQLIEEAMEQGEIKTELSPKRTAKLIIGLVESAAEQVYLYNHSEKEEVEKQQEAVLAFLFAALKL